MPWRVTALLVLLAVLAGGGISLLILTDWAALNSGGLTPAEASTLRLDAIKTALTIAAGIGAGVTLLLALRKQSISERAQRFLEEDTRDQRITEQYVAAADQLGSDKAAVRLAGLYALERLGQDTPQLRQTVTDVLCAYLRMPYDYVEDRQDDELQVRLTAQRLIAAHTRVADGEDEPAIYWWGPNGERMDLHLTGAHLVDFDLSACRVGRLNLSRAVLHRRNDFARLEVFKRASFNGAQFHGPAGFTNAYFHGDVNMSNTIFHGSFLNGRVRFDGTEVIGVADLEHAVFAGDLILQETRFLGRLWLRGTEFRGNLVLESTVLGSDQNLSEARLRELAAEANRKVSKDEGIQHT